MIRARLSLFCIPVLTAVFIMCRRIITVAGLFKFDVAETDRSTWLRYAEPKNFLTVVSKDYTLKADGAQVLFQQGARLQLADKNYLLIR